MVLFARRSMKRIEMLRQIHLLVKDANDNNITLRNTIDEKMTSYRKRSYPLIEVVTSLTLYEKGVVCDSSRRLEHQISILSEL